jgi:hypothetical protein
MTPGSAVSVDAVPATAERDDLHKPSGESQVLHEVDELVLVGGIEVEAESGGQGKAGQRGRDKARLKAEDKKGASDDFYCDGERKSELWKRETSRIDVADRPCGIRNLVETADQEDCTKQYPADKRKRGRQAGQGRSGGGSAGQKSFFHGLSPK